MSEWDESTSNVLWRLNDMRGVSRFETFSLSPYTRYRLYVLVNNARVFGVTVECVNEHLVHVAGCVIDLYGKINLYRLWIEGDIEGDTPTTIRLYNSNLDEAENWRPRFEGQDIPACWYAVFLKIANSENIGFTGGPSLFEVPT
jgi:hypothetical protein